ncbi:hypothetical protein RSAG8_00733, partial [Rhizoctonia solani AG-8 WAC10335]
MTRLSSRLPLVLVFLVDSAESSRLVLERFVTPNRPID